MKRIALSIILMLCLTTIAWGDLREGKNGNFVDRQVTEAVIKLEPKDVLIAVTYRRVQDNGLVKYGVDLQKVGTCQPNQTEAQAEQKGRETAKRMNGAEVRVSRFTYADAQKVKEVRAERERQIQRIEWQRESEMRECRDQCISMMNILGNETFEHCEARCMRGKR